MNPGPDGRRAESGIGTLPGAAILVGVLAAGVGVALVLGVGRPRWAEAVAFAATVTGISGLGGWVAARRPAATPPQAVAHALGAAALRLMLPLAALAWLASRGGPLRTAGAGGLLVAFYLGLLATTIFLHIMGTPSRSPDRVNGGD